MPGYDPVCGMEIAEGDAVGKMDHEGTTYYFCSETCLQRFQREPQRYLEDRPEG